MLEDMVNHNHARPLGYKNKLRSLQNLCFIGYKAGYSLSWTECHAYISRQESFIPLAACLKRVYILFEMSWHIDFRDEQYQSTPHKSPKLVQ